MKYQEEKLRKAQKAIKKVRELADIFCPTDGWLKEARAVEANKHWQEMMSCLDKIGVEVAKERNSAAYFDEAVVIIESKDGN